jgi:hypothetical protein
MMKIESSLENEDVLWITTSEVQGEREHSPAYKVTDDKPCNLNMFKISLKAFTTL